MAMDQRKNDSEGGLGTQTKSEPQNPGRSSPNSNNNPNSYPPMGDLLEEAPEIRIERLGRQRPEVFKSLWAEIGFVFSISMSQVLTEYFVSGFTVILPTLVKSLDIPSASATWPASAFSLTLACFLLVFGLGGFVLHILPGTALVIAAGVAWIVAPLLFAIAPAGANYWAYIFPAMICATIGIDITFTVANIFFTTSLSESQQGLAGSMVMLILHLGIAVCLGFSDIINTYTLNRLGLRRSYHAVFWFEVACAAVSLIIMSLFVEIKRAESELTVDERNAALNDVQLVEDGQSTSGMRAGGADDRKLN
ncbi:hypothetical protein EYC84_003139 [Monilinia fructicola]|uniref:Major facilitator superfamily (MFS) profile domain-containing protein n=1 Tax=Monilinia fructicola TaxID=38448 RepID=A0A5M9JWN5_MONFR|nr:hypothetical protein EYC84_003139 [Monilinia fructicola]